jgi:hypothetical protein
MSARAWVAFAAVSTLWGIPYLFLGVAILGERPGAGAAAGLLLILAGSWLATGGRRPPRPRRPVADHARTRSPKRATQPPAPPSLEPAARALPGST